LDVLRDHLVKSLRGGQAFVPYEKALDGIRPELRSVRPDEALHSIYEELYHMTVAQEDLLYYTIMDVWDSGVAGGLLARAGARGDGRGVERDR